MSDVVLQKNQTSNRRVWAFAGALLLCLVALSLNRGIYEKRGSMTNNERSELLLNRPEALMALQAPGVMVGADFVIRSSSH